MSTTKKATTAMQGSTRNTKRRKGKGKKKRNAFVPIKGGDGGAAVKVRRGPNWSANGLVVLTGASIRCRADREAFELVLVETTDPCDRAHNEKKLVHENAPPGYDTSWELCGLGEIDLPGSEPISRPRRYHPTQVVGRVEQDTKGVVVFDNRVGLDSMFDHAARVAAMLERSGIEMGWHTLFPRAGAQRVESERVQLMASHFAGQSRDQVRNRVQQSTSEFGMTKKEQQADRVGRRWLRRKLRHLDDIDDE